MKKYTDEDLEFEINKRLKNGTYKDSKVIKLSEPLIEAIIALLIMFAAALFLGGFILTYNTPPINIGLGLFLLFFSFVMVSVIVFLMSKRRGKKYY